MTGPALLDGPGFVLIGVYLAALLAIGVAGRLARRENTLRDFYLGGGRLGLLVLFFTLYATQYSGNTMIGFPAQAYRSGFVFLSSVTFMACVVGAYLIFAPRLHRLAKERQYVTPCDYLQDRFGHRALTLLCSGVFIVALANFVLSNLKAVGHLVEAATGGAVPFAAGVIGLALVMVIYQTLGGMRSVAWTDLLQGVLLLIGSIWIFFLLQQNLGGLAGIGEALKQERPEFWAPPDAGMKIAWLSTLLLIFFGVALYPQAIQRIYAAHDAKTLRRSLQLMVFMPLLTTFLVLHLGWMGAAIFPGLDREGSEEIAIQMLNHLGTDGAMSRLLLTFFIAAVMAAIMSTVDSAQLSISSMVTRDWIGCWKPGLSEARLTLTGKTASWIIMGLMVWGALALPATIWELVELKLELLCQIAPALFLGLFCKRIHSGYLLAGIGVGLTVSAVLLLGGGWTDGTIVPRPFGVHAGLWGLGANLLVVGAGHLLIGKRD